MSPQQAETGPAPLHVVFVDHVAIRSGAEIAMLNLIPALPGVHATVILGEDGFLRDALASGGVAAEVLPLPGVARDLRRGNVRPGAVPLVAMLETARYVWRLARRLRELRPDVVHANTLKGALYGCTAARLAGVPSVWHARDTVSPEYLPRAAVALVRLAARMLPTAVISVSEPVRDALFPGAGDKPRRLVVADPVPPVDLPEVGRHEGVVLGVVGRIAPWKGHALILGAFGEAFADRPDVTLHIVGGALFDEGEFEADLHRWVAEGGLAGRVLFTGHVDDVSVELARLDVVVHASLVPEPFGQAVVEAMTAGLAVIAADEGGPAGYISHGRNGLLVRPRDAAALAAAMCTLVDDPALRRRLGADARSATRSRFAPERVGRQVRSCYDTLTRDRRDPAAS